MRVPRQNASGIFCASIVVLVVAVVLQFPFAVTSWVIPTSSFATPCRRLSAATTKSLALSIQSSDYVAAGGAGNLHGQNTCFLPLQQLDNDEYMPRIVQIAGAYPGVTPQEFYAVSSEPSPAQGQWTYDFSDPDGPQLGTVALPGSNIVAACRDPVVLIAEHFSLGVELPPAIQEPVDVLVLVDRAMNRFGERKFLVLNVPGQGITIGAFNSKEELPEDCEILGQVLQVTIPWLPCMTKTKTGFLEADEYF